MYEQYLPDYTTAFKKAPWKTCDSTHYRFYFFEESLAEREIENIVATQEAAFQQILDFLEILPPEKQIVYYLYPDAETKRNLMGSSWFAQSIYNDFSVHALYTEEHRVIGPHEDTHLLSLSFGLSIGFLQEGLAERMVGHDWFGNSFKDTVLEALADEHFIFSSDLLTTHKAWLDTEEEYARQYYALAALFSDYLIAMYGKEKYFELYTSLNRNVSSEENASQYDSILSDNFENIFASWKEWLRK